MTYLETAGRYADLEFQVTSKLANGAPASTTLLSYLCIANGKLKHYDRLFDCTQKLEQSVASNDTGFDLDQRVMFINASDARPLPETLRAQAYLELASFETAVISASQALRILDETPTTGGTSLYPTVRYRLMNLEVLALAAVRMGNVQRAFELATEIRQVSTPFVGGRMWGWIKNNALSRVYMATGSYAEALKYIPANSSGMKLVVSFVNGLGPYAYRGDSTTTVIEIPRLVMRGKALKETGELKKAAEALDQVLSSPRIADMGDIYWVALFERGQIAEMTGQLDKAESHYRQAVSVVELQRSTIATEGNKIGFVGDKQALYARLVNVLVATNNASDAFEYVERSKSRALVDLLSSKHDFYFTGQSRDQTRVMIEGLDASDFSAATTDPDEEDGRRGVQVAQREIKRVAPELATLVTVGAAPLSDLKAQLDEHETLVEFYYHDTDMFAFVLTKRAIHVVKLDATNVTAEVRSLRSALESEEEDAWQAPARSLYQRLWHPLEDLVSEGSITIVAHGVLHYVPFAALQRPDGTFLVDVHALRFLPSASVLLYLRHVEPGNPGDILALGNPDLHDPKLNLAFAESEVRAIAGLYSEARILIRGDATESMFKKESAGFTRLHFATHGHFNADQPLDSGLFLSADSHNDGQLTAGELYTMNLNADLVTLSACETGVGEIANGDDVIGLIRGFLYAGSRSIVASLWSVDDRATGDLMTSFYQNLAEMNKEQALRAAQIKTRATFPNPFFWASFALTGAVD